MTDKRKGSRNGEILHGRIRYSTPRIGQGYEASREFSFLTAALQSWGAVGGWQGKKIPLTDHSREVQP